MRRTLIIAAVLLPLPFAAIPLVSVVVAPPETYAPGILAVNASEDQSEVEAATSIQSSPEDVSLTLRTGEYYSGCGGASTTSFEG